MADVGRPMKYPYSITAKVLQFPWKFYWKRGRGFRYVTIAVIACLPLFYKINKLVNSPGNVQMWNDIRQKRKHNPFATPTEHGHGGH